ncbi:MAG: CPBP family intramembrane metalloprotease [Candidatus Hydrogenedentes bacterium]|nr:CPBP family intramembrane metalloprotease [Candidatus Hydrogenedentota bacterium]
MTIPPLREKITVGKIDFDLRMLISLIMVALACIMARSPLGTPWLAPLFRPFSRYMPNLMGMVHDQCFFFLILPLLVILLVFRENPLKYGLGIGKWRESLVWTVVICAALAVILWFTVGNSLQLKSYYQMYYSAPASKSAPFSPGLGNQEITFFSHVRMFYICVVQLIGWEFILRGFLLFALARSIGPGPAICVQMVPFALMHIGKPGLELYTTPFSGIGFGFIAWRCQSFWPVFLIHLFMLVFVILIAMM